MYHWGLASRPLSFELRNGQDSLAMVAHYATATVDCHGLGKIWRTVFFIVVRALGEPLKKKSLQTCLGYHLYSQRSEEAYRRP